MLWNQPIKAHLLPATYSKQLTVVSVTCTRSKVVHFNKRLGCTYFLSQTAVVNIRLAVGTTQCHRVEVLRTPEIRFIWVRFDTWASDAPGSARSILDTQFVSTVDIVAWSICWLKKTQLVITHQVRNIKMEQEHVDVSLHVCTLWFCPGYLSLQQSFHGPHLTRDMGAYSGDRIMYYSQEGTSHFVRARCPWYTFLCAHEDFVAATHLFVWATRDFVAAACPCNVFCNMTPHTCQP